jgi:hypothetical protein
MAPTGRIVDEYEKMWKSNHGLNELLFYHLSESTEKVTKTLEEVASVPGGVPNAAPPSYKSTAVLLDESDQYLALSHWVPQEFCIRFCMMSETRTSTFT